MKARGRRSQPKRVREPVQVYLDPHDLGLLRAMAARAALSRADVLRLGLRRISAELLGDNRPGSSVEALIGAIDGAPEVPRDLAARHDDYLYGEASPHAKRRLRRKRR